ncbi:MAG: hypothetical protein N2506_06420 [Dehalococcoidales bacterium]|nr:hypothetical protein [Dehalococcoidales bacterium]
MKAKPEVLTEKQPQAEAETGQCRHYWVIETARGPKSSGRCRYCGEIREFLNSMPEYSLIKRRPAAGDGLAPEKPTGGN